MSNSIYRSDKSNLEQPWPAIWLLVGFFFPVVSMLIVPWTYTCRENNTTRMIDGILLKIIFTILLVGIAILAIAHQMVPSSFWLWSLIVFLI